MYYNGRMRHQVPAEIRTVCESLRAAGYEAYLVGGCVRDLVMNRTPKDWDVTTNATPAELQELFPDSFYENAFGTVGVKTRAEDPRLQVVEVTPYRIEGAYSDARRPDEVRFSMSLEDDLKRRDFTVNAIAYDPITDTVIDKHGGQEDIQRRVIRTVGEPSERFAEDALRMLRAVRFSAELDFALESATIAGIAGNASQLAKISRERVRDELVKTLMSPRPMQALYMAQRMGLMPFIIPELDDAIGVEQNQAHSFDVFEHLLRSLQHAADKGWPLDIRLAALLHDIGKPASRRWSDEKKDWTFHGHEVIGARMAQKILADLRVSKETSENVVNLIRWHMFFSDPDQVTLSAVRRVITNVGKEHIEELLNLRICDRIGTGRPKEQPFRLRKYMAMVDQAMRDPISVAMLKIDGKRLMEMGIRPGPRMGWILHALLEEVLEEPAKNTAEYLESSALSLDVLSDDELQERGEAGKDKKAAAEDAEVQRLNEKHHVS